MRTISITSGKGGVGKTTVTANLAATLAGEGKKVLILDGDLGMANVDIFFGVKTAFNISHVLSGEKKMSEVLTEVSKNVFLIPGGSGLYDLNQLNHFQRRFLIESAKELDAHFDYMLIDTAPGLSDNVLFLNAAADQIMLMITGDPSSFADSYALLKVLNTKYKVKSFSILVNNVKDETEAVNLYQKFADVVSKFLLVRLEYAGFFPMDHNLKRCVQLQRLIVRQEPEGVIAELFHEIATQIQEKQAFAEQNRTMTQFFEQVVGMA